MGKAAAGTPKQVANAMKAKGLGRLRWYCQVCQKQMRDDNGFKCHIATEAHLRQMLVVGENSGKHIDEFSQNFMDEFIVLLSRRYNTKRIRANQVYQEYIQDKHHVHMNATKWVTLTDFVKHLGKEGIVRVDETEKGFFISWVDNSPGALARQEAIMKKERQDTDDEQRQRKLLAEQIARASASNSNSEDPTASDGSTAGPKVEEGLKRPAEGGKIAFSFGAPKPVAAATTSAASSSSPAPISQLSSTSTTTSPMPPPPPPPLSTSAPVSNPLKMTINPLKRAAPSTNVFKASSSSSSSSSSKGIARPMSATERLIKEDEERKKRIAENGGRTPFGGAKRVRL
ncbi:Protein containing a U1-type Zn-finger and implicated in RNA splicing or processing [Phaffia rhodozyma]|uniref:Protein containing a U1-type Zn-finger and implicated in RNA splicing or processing n=1 Tax=Phaffia rhodozyma TaxID=264483 RepID=A0A0F7SQC5_PHARH|nr:Protein containing a U1-type Zn-finger and implicated in RNA splicing or processing [Phaffia rhodozyma]